MPDKTQLVVGGGLVRNILVCWLPNQPRPFVHGWILAPDGARDVWLRTDGLWTTDEGDGGIPLPANFERNAEPYQHIGFLFEPAECDGCNEVKPLFFGDADYWERREGSYYCAECLNKRIMEIEEALEKQDEEFPDSAEVRL
jgi:hypothetical protein